jgi:hypothetical protein
MSRMGNQQDRAGHGRAIIDRSLHVVLATADAAGRPWGSPVLRRRGLSASSGLVGAGQVVNMEAEAKEASGVDIDRALAIYSARSRHHGWTGLDPQGSPPMADSCGCTGRPRRRIRCSPRMAGPTTAFQ